MVSVHYFDVIGGLGYITLQYATKLPDLLSLLKFPGEVRALLIPQIGPVDQ